MDHSPLASIEWDSDFIVTRWAGEAEKMFGFTQAETMGKPIMDLHIIYEEDIHLVEGTMAQLEAGQALLRRERGSCSRSPARRIPTPEPGLS